MQRAQNKPTIWRDFDYILLITTLLLIIIGILMIRSATLGAVDTDLINRVPSQIRFTLIGLGVVFAVAALDYRLLGSLHVFIYGFILFILGLVAGLGAVGAAGAQSWLNVGLQVQPSVLGKILLVITLGQFLADRYMEMGRLRTVALSLGHVMVPALMIFVQPDLGTTTVIMFVWFVMVWAAGLTFKHLSLLVLLGLLAMPVLWLQMEPYQRQRITTFIASGETCYDDPELMRSGNCTFVDEDGNGVPDIKDARYNIDQALISIGSGGLMGKGYGNGSQTQGRFRACGTPIHLQRDRRGDGLRRRGDRDRADGHRDLALRARGGWPPIRWQPDRLRVAGMIFFRRWFPSA